MKRLILLTTAVVLAMTLTACGDDSGDDAGGDSNAEAAGVTTTTAAPGLDPAICDSVSALNDAVIGMGGEEPTPEFVEGTLLPAVNDVVTAAADEDSILGPALEIQGLLEDAVGGAPIDDTEITPPYNAVLAPTHDGCGFEAVDVTAVNYEFQGVPDSVPAGHVSFALTNDGTETHEMIVFRKADGETRTAEELAQLSEDEFGAAATFATAMVVEPGQSGYAIADLDAGTYVGFCFLPVGGAEDGAPHFTRGMLTEFEVA